MKNIRITKVVYEALLNIGKSHKPNQLKPEQMLEVLVLETYRTTRT